MTAVWAVGEAPTVSVRPVNGGRTALRRAMIPLAPAQARVRPSVRAEDHADDHAVVAGE